MGDRVEPVGVNSIRNSQFHIGQGGQVGRGGVGDPWWAVPHARLCSLRATAG